MLSDDLLTWRTHVVAKHLRQRFRTVDVAAVRSLLAQGPSMESAYDLLSAQYKAQITVTSWTEQFRSVLRHLTRIFTR